MIRNSDHMPCHACDGTGHVPLPSYLQRTLDILRRGPLTSIELRRHMEKGRTGTGAANNRLEKLRRLGYCRRDLDGKTWVYSLVVDRKAAAL
jgi:hypothetical protein